MLFLALVLAASPDPTSSPAKDIFELDTTRKYQLLAVMIGLVFFAALFVILDRVGARRARAKRAKEAAQVEPEAPVWNEPPKPKEIYIPQPHKLESDRPPAPPPPTTEYQPRDGVPEPVPSPYFSSGETVPPFVSAPTGSDQAYPLPYPGEEDTPTEIDPVTGLPVFKPRPEGG
jgi:hypothetical protein